MHLSKSEILEFMREWLNAWDEHDLDGVMDHLHDDIVFENWTGAIIRGKNNLRKSWFQWFRFHGNFKFTEEDIFIDEQAQKVMFKWRLDWPSMENDYKGKNEIRRGVDVLHFLDGKILKKYSYSKTTIQIDRKLISLSAQKSNVSEYQASFM